VKNGAHLKRELERGPPRLTLRSFVFSVPPAVFLLFFGFTVVPVDACVH
jgi:hypothetical protein